MWVPKTILDYFGVNVELVRNLQVDLAVARSEAEAAKLQLAVTNNTLSWLQMKVNQLELEKAGLIEKVYNIKVPVPEILRTPLVTQDFSHILNNFEDIGDERARELGYTPHN